MSHARKRHCVPLLLKKLSFSPVVALQGARQTGKSFLARDLVPGRITGYVYVTFDQFSLREFARKNPETFLLQKEEAGTLAIDEAQKVPDIFDAVKHRVDLRRVPGQYLLLGSTEFSKMLRIREALTGRMSRLRLFPLNLAETRSLPPNPSGHPFLLLERPRIERAELLRYLQRGGLPGIFAVRNAAESESLLRDWLDLTVSRDVLTFPGLTIEPDLCLALLQKIATLEAPTEANMARALKRDGRRVKTHLKVLQALFVVNALGAHPLGTGKQIYFLHDVSLACLLGADHERQLWTWALQEQLSQRAYRDDRHSGLFYYRTSKGSIVHLVCEDADTVSFLKILPDEALDRRELILFKSLAERKTEKRKLFFALGAERLRLKQERIEVYPWESMG